MDRLLFFLNQDTTLLSDGLTSFAALSIVSPVNCNHEQRLLLLLLSLHLLRLVSGRDREGFGRREEQMS